MRKTLLVALTLIVSGLPFFANVPRAMAAPDTQAIGQTLFYLVNKERAQHGLSSLSTDHLLASAALRKATDMMAQGYFEHNSPSGRVFHEWIDETGYKYTIAGENLAANMNTISPEKMVEYWMASPLHRANILSGEYTETGLGVVSGIFQGQETVFVVQAFANPVGEEQKPTVTADTKSAPLPNKPTPKTAVLISSSSPILKPDRALALSSTSNLHIVSIKAGEEPVLEGIVAGASVAATSSAGASLSPAFPDFKNGFLDRLINLLRDLFKKKG